jgi:tetratricopeptide (TPR) repeat protein
LTTNIESIEKLISEDPTNWVLREKLNTHLYKSERDKEINTEEYILKVEENTRGFLNLVPEHTIAKQTLADILKKKLMIVITKHDKLQIYRELVILSSRKTVEDEYITFLYTNLSIFASDHRPEIINVILQTESFPDYLLSVIDHPKNCYEKAINNEDELMQLEVILWRLHKLNLDVKYSETLATLLYNRIDFSGQLTLQDYENNQESLFEVTKVSPNNMHYKSKYIEFMQSMEQFVLSEVPNEEQRVYLLVSIYQTLFKLQPDNENVIDKLEKTLLQNISIIERNFRGNSAIEHKLNIYNKLLKCRPNSTYRKVYRDLTLQSGRMLKSLNNFHASHIQFDNLLADSTSSVRDRAKANYYKGLAYMQEQKWNEAYQCFNVVTRYSTGLYEELKFEFYLAYAICCMHNGQQEKASSILQTMRNQDQEKKYIKETEFVNMYINLFSNIKKFNLFEASKNENRKITPQELDRLLDSTLDEGSKIIILDRRNASFPILYGPKGDVTLKPIAASVLSYIMHLRYPVPGNIILENTGTADRQHKPFFQEINKKIKEVIINPENHSAKLANYIAPNGYLWQYPYPTYVIEEE